MIGVVVCPITSGDTAFRSARLTLSDWLKIDQDSYAKDVYKRQSWSCSSARACPPKSVRSRTRKAGNSSSFTSNLSLIHI